MLFGASSVVVQGLSLSFLLIRAARADTFKGNLTATERTHCCRGERFDGSPGSAPFPENPPSSRGGGAPSEQRKPRVARNEAKQPRSALAFAIVGCLARSSQAEFCANRKAGAASSQLTERGFSKESTPEPAIRRSARDVDKQPTRAAWLSANIAAALARAYLGIIIPTDTFLCHEYNSDRAFFLLLHIVPRLAGIWIKGNGEA
jgi:hypothetical protein